LNASIGHAKNKANGFDQALPTGGFRFKLPSAFARQLIEFCFPSRVGFFLVGSEETAVFQAVQRRVERSFRNLDHSTRYLFEPLSYGVSVDRLNSNGLQN
jgi:hypothetical protein